jgi:hypothetical protein
VPALRIGIIYLFSTAGQNPHWPWVVIAPANLRCPVRLSRHWDSAQPRGTTTAQIRAPRIGCARGLGTAIAAARCLRHQSGLQRRVYLSVENGSPAGVAGNCARGRARPAGLHRRIAGCEKHPSQVRNINIAMAELFAAAIAAAFGGWPARFSGVRCDRQDFLSGTAGYLLCAARTFHFFGNKLRPGQSTALSAAGTRRPIERAL